MELLEKYRNELSLYFQANNMPLSAKVLNLLANYALLLVQKNQSVNLISRKDVANVIENHVFISSFISKYFPTNISNFVDIGTGGGLPGIPLAIVMQFPEALLVDSTKKKYFAVRDFIKDLNLPNVRAANARVEEKSFIREFGGRFELTVSRATVNLAKLIEYSLPLLKSKGFVYSLKGGDVSAEIRQAKGRFKAFVKNIEIKSLNYKPTNEKNEKEKKLIIIEIER